MPGGGCPSRAAGGWAAFPFGTLRFVALGRAAAAADADAADDPLFTSFFFRSADAPALRDGPYALPVTSRQTLMATGTEASDDALPAALRFRDGGAAFACDSGALSGAGSPCERAPPSAPPSLNRTRMGGARAAALKAGPSADSRRVGVARTRSLAIANMTPPRIIETFAPLSRRRVWPGEARIVLPRS